MRYKPHAALVVCLITLGAPPVHAGEERLLTDGVLVDSTAYADPLAPLDPSPIRGDANLDGFVSTADLAILAGSFAQTVDTADGGDLNGDGVVDVFDLVELASVFDDYPRLIPAPGIEISEIRPRPVPFPDTLGLFAASPTTAEQVFVISPEDTPAAILSGTFGTTPSAVPAPDLRVPEPSTLLAATALGLVALHRRRLANPVTA